MFRDAVPTSGSPLNNHENIVQVFEPCFRMHPDDKLTMREWDPDSGEASLNKIPQFVCHRDGFWTSIPKQAKPFLHRHSAN